ncbi:MAG: hypothetical protein ACK56F_08430 [bacterium]
MSSRWKMKVTYNSSRITPITKQGNLTRQQAYQVKNSRRKRRYRDRQRLTSFKPMDRRLTKYLTNRWNLATNTNR